MKLKPPKKSDHPPNSEAPKRHFGLRKLDRLEVYLIAADNPVGRKQLRPIFRRKRAKEVLTREQVTAIKLGRKVLRREMKEQGFKRWIDFNVTAENLGLYFDHKGFLWPFFLWLMKGSTVAKILATTAVLTTLITVTEPVIEYVIQYVTQYVTQYITQYVDRIVTEYVDKIVDKDRFTIHLSDEMLNKGLELSETPDFADPQEVLFCIPSWDVPCVSIAQIPSDVDQTDGNHHDVYFAYTFYCRYINKEADKAPDGDLTQYAIDYDWGIRINQEGLDSSEWEDTEPTGEAEAHDEETAPDTDTTAPTDPVTGEELEVSDAVWVMVIQDGEVIVSAKRVGLDENGNPIPEKLPSDEKLETERVAYIDRSIDYINQGLAKIDPRLNADTVTVNKLYELYGDRAEEYWDRIDAFFEKEGISDLTRLMLRTENWRERYNIVGTRGDYNYYQVSPECFVDDETVVQRTRTGVLPWAGDHHNMHKYTVVLWLEGDDPQCVNELMNGHIGLNFQIKGSQEDFLSGIITDTNDPDATEESTEPTGAA